MNHKKYKEWIQLFLYDELTQSEKDELLNHLKDCNECNAELDKLKRFYSSLNETALPEPDQNLLSEARREFNAALRVERSKRKSPVFSFFNLSEFLFSPIKIAFGSAAVLIVGIFVGYLLFNKEIKPGIQTILQDNNINGISSLEEDTRITNVRFIDQDASDGEIEFTFEAIKPVHIKGNINDERIQNVLVYSMLNEQNPGVRLNAINVIGEKTPSGMTEKTQMDNDIKMGLLSVVKYDENPGVRREALKLLRAYPYDDEIKEALLYVLMNDENSSLRIEAISGLNEASKKGMNFNPEELSVFKERMERDENNYVRYQAKTVLKEYNLNEN